MHYNVQKTKQLNQEIFIISLKGCEMLISDPFRFKIFQQTVLF